jgi:hypothetical protein
MVLAEANFTNNELKGIMERGVYVFTIKDYHG